MNPAVLSEVMALPPADKLELIDKLWESMTPDLDELNVSEEEKRLLDERWEKFLAHPDSALTLDQLKDAVASRLK